MTGDTRGRAEMLSFENVSNSYGSEAVLDEVSLALAPQDVEVVIGPSGSGKSTLLRCVNRLTDIDAGEIRLDGQELSGLDENELRRRVGMVFQQFNLFAHRTALGNVTLGPRVVKGLSSEAARELGQEHLRRVGLADQADAYPSELSGGQQQRVGIARALAMGPELMLFDEPTSALDPELIGEVLRVMRDLAEAGMTMLCATHEMGFAREVATSVTFLEEGRIVERGPPAQLFESPREERTREFLSRLDDPTAVDRGPGR
jgi:polar amino acid transport system ATP-binding protein